MARGYPVKRMTPNRAEWMLLLERDGMSRRNGWGVVPFQCMRLGWTRWVDPENGDFREELTADGRKELEAWRSETP